MPGPFAGIPLLDHHCHSLLRQQPVTAEAFRAQFSESGNPEIVERHAPWSLFYRRALRDLAGFFGCAPTEAAVVEARARRPFPDLVRAMFTDAGIGAVLVDLGFRRREQYDLPDLVRLLPCPAVPILRLETLIEDRILSASGWPDLEAQVVGALEAAPAGGIVALKTIIAYRTGLRIVPWDAAALARSFEETRAAFSAGRQRLVTKPLLDTLLWRALEVAARYNLPFQFHTGFGDPDLDLRLANPLWLRQALEHAPFRTIPIVLLHCHPYVREAAWLAAVYPQVSIDLSLTIPFLAHGAADAITEALATAPATKVLLATDAFSIPELFWLGARHAREALDAALTAIAARGYLTPAEREPIARLLLYDNAAALYRMPPGAA